MDSIRLELMYCSRLGYTAKIFNFHGVEFNILTDLESQHCKEN